MERLHVSAVVHQIQEANNEDKRLNGFPPSKEWISAIIIVFLKVGHCAKKDAFVNLALFAVEIYQFHTLTIEYVLEELRSNDRNI